MSDLSFVRSLKYFLVEILHAGRIQYYLHQKNIYFKKNSKYVHKHKLHVHGARVRTIISLISTAFVQEAKLKKIGCLI